MTEKRYSEAIDRLTWEITAIHAHLEEIQRVWARVLGISRSQWMILMAISDLDDGSGVPVKTVAKILHVDGSFATTQSNLLEKIKLVRRRPCRMDGRVVRLFLSDRALKLPARESERNQAVTDSVFTDFEEAELNKLIAQLTLLERRLKTAKLRVTLEL
ncbi:MarR family transcriptional regulator [Bradyrhizobium diazoefficiens]|nr:MarR family transcriptional regulator [Bradyrhizobium diazoefficiens]MBR0979269.1 MarR family transcriptional regulator [Bradyrhizobium diazoefficiens]MBR1008661.1 MarR family transcriptional regulator [Bradyrhizobium diazoefficiens]MBR1014790.1 MarR family transcriptional regulator [Bradyrhizobium diazoefficiens]MBR1052622.1 MarR family transcriptional regulator [Bradyrhizobium diazoefficiens]